MEEPVLLLSLAGMEMRRTWKNMMHNTGCTVHRFILLTLFPIPISSFLFPLSLLKPIYQTASSVFPSGGGFSRWWARPSYQVNRFIKYSENGLIHIIACAIYSLRSPCSRLLISHSLLLPPSFLLSFSYQDKPVSAYLALGKQVNLPSETLFNASGAGYPDVALHAENFALTQVRRERERQGGGRERRGTKRERETGIPILYL